MRISVLLAADSDFITTVLEAMAESPMVCVQQSLQYLQLQKDFVEEAAYEAMVVAGQAGKFSIIGIYTYIETYVISVHGPQTSVKRLLHATQCLSDLPSTTHVQNVFFSAPAPTASQNQQLPAYSDASSSATYLH